MTIILVISEILFVTAVILVLGDSKTGKIYCLMLYTILKKETLWENNHFSTDDER